MTTYQYRVTAVCKATVTETWRITSPTPLDQEEIEDLLRGGTPMDGVSLECTAEETSDEEDRDVTEWELTAATRDDRLD